MTDTHWDCRTWMPGKTVLTANVPFALAPGVYNILFYILDPDTSRPGILLANAGHDGNKRYDLGAVTVVAEESTDADLDTDGDVDGSDLWEMRAAFNSAAGDENFNPNADLDDNMKIDENDLIRLSSDYGK